VHDKFHVAKYLTEAVDQVRRAENKDLQTHDDDRLTGTRQLWLYNTSNLSPKQRRRLAAIKRKGLKTAKAWAIEEKFRWFWRRVYPMSARDLFKQWYG
jgi:transposase